MIRLGYACSNLTLNRKIQSLRLQILREQGVAYLQSLVDANMDLLVATLRWNQDHQIQIYRLSPHLIPLNAEDGVDLDGLTFGRTREIAAFTQDMRLSMHPGQYIQPSAEGAIWQQSYQDLCGHAFVLDEMGISEGDLVLHAGGVSGDRSTVAERMIRNINALPASVRHHLRLENDERCWSIHDLLPVCEATGIPLVADNLHHQLNGSGAWKDLPWTRILATWSEKRPKLHYSEQNPAKQVGAHSAYVDASRFQAFAEAVPFEEYDVMLECKAKEMALLKLRAELKETQLCVA